MEVLILDVKEDMNRPKLTMQETKKIERKIAFTRLQEKAKLVKPETAAK